jgi:hypothetical protein
MRREPSCVTVGFGLSTKRLAVKLCSSTSRRIPLASREPRKEQRERGAVAAVEGARVEEDDMEQKRD